MSITIEFATPEEEAEFKAKAAADGMSVSEWIKRLVRQRAVHASAEERPTTRAAVAKIRELQARVKPLGLPIREAIDDGRR